MPYQLEITMIAIFLFAAFVPALSIIGWLKFNDWLYRKVNKDD